MRFQLALAFLLLYCASTFARPVAKRGILSSIVDLSSIKKQAIDYIKGIPARWREFIPEELYQKGMQKYNQIKDHLEHFFEGDIAGIGLQGQGNQTAVLAQESSAADESKYLWANGVVPYEISTAFAEHENEVIKGALDDISRKTCIKFVPHSNEKDYVQFVRRGMGCSSYVAKQGGRQYIDLQPGCIYEFGEVQHEVMHALGFYHEQSRTDRDDFVSIVWDNVKPDQQDQFKKYVSNTFGLKYDYDSIMHYGWNYFAIDPSKPTILPKVKAGIGNRKAMSVTDVEKINRMYKCPQAGHQVKIPLQWTATRAPNPDFVPVVTPAPGAKGATKCFLKQKNSPETTTSSGIGSWLMNKFTGAVKEKATDFVCSYVGG